MPRVGGPTADDHDRRKWVQFLTFPAQGSSPPPHRRNHRYDLLDRIASGSATGTTQEWTYDANGNRLTQNGTISGTYVPSTTSNRLNSISGSPVRTYTYDAAGNTLTYSTDTFTYYNDGRMKTAKVGSSTTTYVYNALGQRVKKSGGSAGTVLVVYDEAGHILGEYGSTGTIVQETVWMGDIPVATIRPSSVVYYVHADHLNAPRMVTQPSTNKIAWRWDTDPFGTVAPNQNPQSLGTFVYNLRYPGQYYDSETGLNQNYFRDYDPLVGRFVESDPIGLYGGTYSTYAYASSSPLIQADPSGLVPPPRGTTVPSYLPPGSFDFPWPGTPAATAWAQQMELGLEDTFDSAIRTAAAIYRACTQNNDFCHDRWDREDKNCSQWRGLGPRVVAACKRRAADRRTLCIRNGGTAPPDEPGEYNPFKDYPR